MESQAGSLLTKIAAIINLALAGLIFILGIIAIIGVSIYEGVPYNVLILFLVVMLILFAFGFLLLYFSNQMKNPKKVKSASIWAIVLGIISVGNFTGILALVGVIVGLIDSEK